MATLNSLPNECCLLVYDMLEDFDEAYSLAQSCRRFRGLLQGSYVGIMRSIIVRSATYSYDIRLCQFINEIDECSCQSARGSEPPTHRQPSGQSFIQCYFASAKNLTEAQVFSVINRWQRVRRLQNLYLRSSVPGIPLKVTLQPEFHRLEHRARRTSGASRFSLHGDVDLNCSHKHLNYKFTRRFYKASMAYWLAIEARHIARVSRYRTAEEQALVYELLERLWINGEERTLVDAMDLLEVYVFLYESLLGKILSEGRSLQCGIAGGMCRCTLGWDYFVRSCCLNIRPLQIADLIPGQREPVPRPLPHGKAEFVGLCGIINRQGDLLDGSVSGVPDDWCSVGDLERDVELKMIAMGSGDYTGGYANIWACYRKHWDEQASTVFQWAESSEDVIRRVDRYARESACLKVHPDFVHLSKRFEGV